MASVVAKEGIVIEVIGTGYYNPVGFNEMGEYFLDERDFQPDIEDGKVFTNNHDIYREANILKEMFPRRSIIFNQVAVAFFEFHSVDVKDLKTSDSPTAKTIRTIVNTVTAMSPEDVELIPSDEWKTYKQAKKLLD